jgi:hypothetical protein
MSCCEKKNDCGAGAGLEMRDLTKPEPLPRVAEVPSVGPAGYVPSGPWGPSGYTGGADSAGIGAGIARGKGAQKNVTFNAGTNALLQSAGLRGSAVPTTKPPTYQPQYQVARTPAYPAELGPAPSGSSFLQNSAAFNDRAYREERKKHAMMVAGHGMGAEQARARMGAASAVAKVAQQSNTVAWVPKAGISASPAYPLVMEQVLAGPMAARLVVYRQLENRAPTIGDSVAVVGEYDPPAVGKVHSVPTWRGGQIGVTLNASKYNNKKILVKPKHVLKPIVPDGLACLVALEGEPQRWAPALALLTSRFPGEFSQDVCASGGLRAVLATVEKLHDEELLEDHMNAYIEAAKFLNKWAMAGRINALLPAVQQILTQLAPLQFEKSILETAWTWVWNDNKSWDASKVLPEAPDSDEAMAQHGIAVCADEKAIEALVSLVRALEPHLDDPRAWVPLIDLGLQLAEQQQLPSLRVVSAALALLTAVRRRGTAVALDQMGQDGFGGDIVLFTRNFLRLAPVCQRLRSVAPKYSPMLYDYDYDEEDDEEDYDTSSGEEAD